MQLIAIRNSIDNLYEIYLFRAENILWMPREIYISVRDVSRTHTYCFAVIRHRQRQSRIIC